MNVDANALLVAIIAAFGGFFLKYVWDSLIKRREEKENKAEKYDKEVLEDEIKEIIKQSGEALKKELNTSIENFRKEANDTFAYWKDMYWKAVNDLNEVEADFNNLKKQDLAFYKFQLINACKKYIAQGNISQYQFDRLSELHKIYNDLHGNAQGDLYFEKASRLPMVADNAYRRIDQIDDEIYVTETDMIDPHAEEKLFPIKKEGELK
jgi:cell division protein FtsI/penicillin-binding protein 2